MKLLVAGATGTVGTEVIRQALGIPAITSIVALARRDVPIPPKARHGAEEAKLKTVKLPDFLTYNEEARRAIAGADACIWTLAVTPSKFKSSSMTQDELRTICVDYTLAGLRAIHDARTPSATPLRFVYVSGALVDDSARRVADLLSTPYAAVRRDSERVLHEFADAHAGEVDVTITRPGLLEGPGRETIVSSVLSAAIAAGSSVGLISKMHLSELAAVMLDVAVTGSEKKLWSNAEVVERSKSIMKSEDYVK